MEVESNYNNETDNDTCLQSEKNILTRSDGSAVFCQGRLCTIFTFDVFSNLYSSQAKRL